MQLLYIVTGTVPSSDENDSDLSFQRKRGGRRSSKCSVTAEAYMDGKMDVMIIHAKQWWWEDMRLRNFMRATARIGKQQCYCLGRDGQHLREVSKSPPPPLDDRFTSNPPLLA